MPASPKKSFHLPESSPHYRRQRDFRTDHIKIELRLDMQRKGVEGSCTLTVSPLRKGVREVQFDAVDFDVGGVSVDGKPVKFAYDGKTLSVPIEGGFDEQVVVRVEYSAVPKEGLYFTGPEAEYPAKEVQAWTHSEAEFARYWFPCHDQPDEKSSSEIVLKVPMGFTVISNGKLLSKEDAGDETVFHWKEELPHSSYLTSFVAARLGRIEQSAQGVVLGYNFPESKRGDVLRYFGETPRMIEVFGELTGVKYPYPKYDQTTVQDFVFGGMENFNATTFAMSYYPDAQSEEDFQTSYTNPHTNAVNLVAHELAHQWFGDLVTCRDWSHAWLNEAFATYLQALYLEKTRGIDQMRWDLDARTQEYFEEDDTEYRRAIVDRCYVFPDDVFDFALYEKGASMIHELRFIMGDDAFFKGMKEYLEAFAFKNADSHDLLMILEKSSGLSLEEFFDQAFHKPGHPEFKVEYAWDEAGRSATLKVRQVQSHEDGTPVFKLPCEVVFYVGGSRVVHRVMLDAGEQTLAFSLPRRPDIVEFDPRHWIMKKVEFEKGEDLLLNQLAGSEDAWSRAEAAKALGELKRDSAVQALSAAARKEQFWDVRAKSLVALGEIGSPDALVALLVFSGVKDRRVRRALAKALGSFKQVEARVALQAMLGSDESPYVRCEAALALARCWPEGALGSLKEAMKVHSPNETLAEACLEAMGKLKDPEVESVIAENLAYGKPVRVRIGALKAIKGRGFVTESELPVLRDIITKDKEFRVRLQLVGHLIPALGDRRFLDAVKEASLRDKDPRVRRKALETYYDLLAGAEASTALSKLRSEVESLKETNARLLRDASAT